SGAMKNWPPCCGLWLPCGRSVRFGIIGVPSAQTPRSIWLISGWSGQVNVSDTVIWTSGRWSIGHAPGIFSAICWWAVAVQMVASLTGTSFILQMGQSPGDDSTASGCIGQVIESGGTSAGGELLPRCGAPAASVRDSSQANEEFGVMTGRADPTGNCTSK